jgi:superfamily II DNA/RNA helicase
MSKKGGFGPKSKGPSTALTTVPAAKPAFSFIEDTFEDDDGNIVEIDTAVQKIGLNAKQKKKVKGGGFQSMDLAPEVFEGVKAMGFNIPTPIQRQAIPILLEGADVVAMARTGSGKTAAFTIPLLHRLATNKPINMGHGSSRGVRAVVLSPTRELAQQTHHVIQKIGKALNYRIIMLIGGQSLSQQFELISNSPDIIVATPGRLVHHLIEVQFSLQSVEFVCFDEADRLFEMGFAQQLYEIIKRMNDNRQTCLFSATMPQALIEFSRAGLKSPISVRLDSESKLSPDLQVSFFHVKSNEKNAALMFILRTVLPKSQQAIVFVSTRHHVDFLVLLLQHAGIETTGIYGQMEAESRIENIEAFKSKKTRVLVVTDLAARGIDIPLLDNVIHYDFPTQPKLFIHRSGRVARAGQKGTAFTLVSPDDMPYLIDLFLFFAWKLPFIQKEKATKSLSEKDAQTKENDKNGQSSQNKKNGDDDNDENDDDDDNRLTEREEEMERLVDFGLIPTSLLDFEVEHCSSLIKANDLERLVIGCDNAYEKYSTSKGYASRASREKWRGIRGLNIKQVIEIHPWFFRESVKQLTDSKGNTVSTHNPGSIKSMIVAEQAKDKIASYTPSMTIFELNNKNVDIIRQKRLMHDRVIVNKHGLREVVGDRLASQWEEEQERLHKEEALNNPETVIPKLQHTILVKVKQNELMNEQKITVTAADRRKRKTLDEKYKTGKISIDEYVSGLKSLPPQLQSNPADQNLDVIKNKQNAPNTKTVLKPLPVIPTTGPKNDNKPPQIVDFNAQISRSDRPPMLMGLLPGKATKRVLPPGDSDDDDDDDMMTNNPVDTKLDSRVEQQIRAELLKRLTENASKELVISDNSSQARKKKRSQMTQDELRDSNYISLTPSGNRYEELGLSLGHSRLEDMALELNAEDGEGRRIQQKTRKWSEHSKKFVTIYSSKDAFGKVITNEAGQKVNKDYVPGQLYADWRSKNRKLEQIVDNEDAPGGSKKDFRRKMPRGGFKSIDDDAGKSRKGGKRPGSSGVLDASQLMKSKQTDEKNKRDAKRDAFNKKKGGKGKGRK